MFTGLISDVGIVKEISQLSSGIGVRIESNYQPETILMGASIACDGPCLTVVALEKTENGCIFDIEASVETLDRTTLGDWVSGTRINLERSLRAGDELGGHIVSGHVDGVGTITGLERTGDMTRFDVEIPEALARYVAEKGSISLAGTSLTVNGINGRIVSLLLIPHSLTVTTWGEKKIGDRLNIEIDMLARYAERVLSYGQK